MQFSSLPVKHGLTQQAQKPINWKPQPHKPNPWPQPQNPNPQITINEQKWEKSIEITLKKNI